MDSLLERSQRLVTEGRHAEARPLLTQAVRDSPRSAELWFWLARTLPNPAQATEALRRVLQLRPDYEAAQELQTWVQAGGSPTDWVPPVPPSAAPDADKWDLLAELDNSPRTVSTPPLPPPTPVAPSLLEELGDTATPVIPKSRVVAAPPSQGSLLDEIEEGTYTPTASAPAPAMTAEILWARATQFIGAAPPRNLPVVNSALPFSAQDVPPALAAPTLSKPTAATLQQAQVRQILAGETTRSGAKAGARPKPRPTALGNTGGRVGSVLGFLLFFALLVAALWAVLRYNLIPASTLTNSPAVATTVAEAHLRLAPVPTPLALSGDVASIQSARYDNRLPEAIALAREAVTNSPDNLALRVLLSDILRDQPASVGESLQVADAAFGMAQDLPERTYAAQAVVYALAAQPAPDTARAASTGAQAAFDVPNSPHAQWARAMAAALEGDGTEARAAATLAVALDSGLPAAVATARRAEIEAILGNVSEAQTLYERALAETDYVPWRVALIDLLQNNGMSDQASEHLDALRALDSTHPLVQ